MRCGKGSHRLQIRDGFIVGAPYDTAWKAKDQSVGVAMVDLRQYDRKLSRHRQVTIDRHDRRIEWCRSRL